MAIITSIQRRAYILVAIIAIALITFLFEFINPNLGFLNSKPTYIGKVNGNELSYEDFNKLLEKRQVEMSQGEKRNLTEEEVNTLRDQIWSEFVVKNAITERFEENGFLVTAPELVEITTGGHIDPTMNQVPIFKNQMGQYDPVIFKNFMRTLGQDEPGMAPGTRRRQWLEFEKQIINNRKVEKFNALVSNSLYVPKWMMDYEKSIYSAQCDIKYVALPYENPDSSNVKVDEKGLEEYFKKHKAQYIPVEPTVKLVTATFRLLPSSADSVDIMNRFNEKLAKMQASTNDTTFFRAYGDRGYESKYYSMQDLAQNPVGPNIINAQSGQIIGPYLDKELVKATKVIRRKNVADSVLVQTITISFKDAMQSQEAVMQRYKIVDSIFRDIDTLGKDFGQIAAQVSADRGAGLQPQWVYRQDQRFVQQIFDDGGTQKYFKSPSDQEGVLRIVKVVNFPANKPAFQLGEISVPYTPSTETQNLIYSNAMKFIETSNTEEEFEKNVVKYPNAFFGTTSATQNVRQIDGVNGNAREAIRWAFNSEDGTKSSLFQIGSNYVVCLNGGLRSKDHLELSDVKNEVTSAYKIQLVKENTAKKMVGNTLEEIAAKLNTTVGTITDFSFANPYIGEQNAESKVVAAASVLKPNKISQPIEGYLGAYRILVTKEGKREINPADELNAKMQLNQQQKATTGLIESMIDDVKIEDNRVNMF